MRILILVFAGMIVIATTTLAVAGWLFYVDHDMPAFVILVAGAAFFFRLPAGISVRELHEWMR